MQITPSGSVLMKQTAEAPGQAPKPEAAISGFFAHHGIWAIGVRWFRNLRFHTKASIVSGLLLLPLLVLMMWTAKAQWFEWNSLSRHAVGTQLLQQSIEVHHLVLERRRLAAAGQSGTASAASNDQALKQVTAQLNGLVQQTEWADVRDAWQALVRSLDEVPMSGAPTEVFARHNAWLDRFYAWQSITSNHSRLRYSLWDHIQDTWYAAVHELPRLADQVARMRGALAAAKSGRVAQDEAAPIVAAASASVQERLAGLEHTLARIEEHQGLTRSAAALQAVERLIREGAQASGEAQVLQLGTQAIEAIKQLQDELVGQLAHAVEVEKGALANHLLAFLALLSISLLLAVYFIYSFFLVVDGGLREISKHIKAMANGDLTTQPTPWGKDEAARVMNDLRVTQESLRAMVRDVRDTSDEITHSAEEIANGAMDLSARTERTAANLEETAATMEQISGTVKSTATHAEKAAQLAERNAKAAADGGSVMQQVVNTMNGIESSAQRIGEIIGTIDGIAFQTNILALNAAVEAARAGEAGRGFAVVASEVRNLAQRSSSAAREIKSLIQASIERTTEGSRVVAQAHQAIETLVRDAQDLGQVIGQIATGAREQALGVEQIGQAAQELDRSTQQNAALVEETAAAAQTMKQLTEHLQQRMQRFRLPQAAARQLSSDLVGERTEDFDFQQAIEAHRSWKVKLRQAIAKKEKLDADTLCRDDRCPLGRWLHGPGGARWGSRPSFRSLVDEHAQFHRTLSAVAEHVNAGRMDQALKDIGSGSRFADASNRTIEAILRLQRELG
ncbi:methyl-accepting chemotaxis protein [Caldimonas sp.]|uniref:methyl-accepting chemotaxis protein n=1 Tax=Caldimonas sp. TaxID=2838790 RepID=UPI003918F09F